MTAGSANAAPYPCQEPRIEDTCVPPNGVTPEIACLLYTLPACAEPIISFVAVYEHNGLVGVVTCEIGVKLLPYTPPGGWRFLSDGITTCSAPLVELSVESLIFDNGWIAQGVIGYNDCEACAFESSEGSYDCSASSCPEAVKASAIHRFTFPEAIIDIRMTSPYGGCFIYSEVEIACQTASEWFPIP